VPALAVWHLAFVTGGYMPTLLFQILMLLGLMVAVLAPVTVWTGLTRSIPQRALRLRFRLRLLAALEGLAVSTIVLSGAFLTVGLTVQLRLVILGGVVGIISTVGYFQVWFALQRALQPESRPEDVPRRDQ
jgi:hypothetical protein